MPIAFVRGSDALYGEGVRVLYARARDGDDGVAFVHQVEISRDFRRLFRRFVCDFGLVGGKDGLYAPCLLYTSDAADEL